MNCVDLGVGYPSRAVTKPCLCSSYLLLMSYDQLYLVMDKNYNILWQAFTRVYRSMPIKPIIVYIHSCIHTYIYIHIQWNVTDGFGLLLWETSIGKYTHKVWMNVTC